MELAGWISLGRCGGGWISLLILTGPNLESLESEIKSALPWQRFSHSMVTASYAHLMREAIRGSSASYAHLMREAIRGSSASYAHLMREAIRGSSELIRGNQSAAAASYTHHTHTRRSRRRRGAIRARYGALAAQALDGRGCQAEERRRQVPTGM